MIEKVTRLKIELPNGVMMQFDDETGKSSVEVSEEEAKGLFSELSDYFTEQYYAGIAETPKDVAPPFEDEEGDEDSN